MRFNPVAPLVYAARQMWTSTRPILFLATFKNDAHANNGFVWHVKARKRETNPGKSGSGQLQLITQLRKDLGVFLEIVFKISMYVMYVCKYILIQ